jgi:hypothetical protein
LLFLAVVCAIVAVAFARILPAPFVFDDYGHITDASQSSWRATLSLFGPAAYKPALFFRPFGFLLYRLNYLWAGGHPVRWHAGSISMHAMDSWLVYLICRKFGFARSGSACACLLFAVNGCAAVPVAWIDAGFDLMTTGFVLLALIFVCRYLDSGSRGYLAAALGATFAALLCKESAFCLPALVGGIGGYGVRGAGAMDVLRHNFIPRMNALLLRQWAILFFPVNWSTPAGPALKAALAALPILLAMLAALARPIRRQFLACLGFTLAAAIPAQKMLLIGLDLSGTRTLYLPNVGMAIAWGLLLGALGWRPQAVLLCGLLAFQTLTLEHNLVPWRSVPELVRSTCVALGRQMAPGAGPVVVRGLPATRSGVVFLANGFRECVQMNTGIGGDRIHVENSPGGGVFPTPSTGTRGVA